jgi:hypothetical protein
MRVLAFAFSSVVCVVLASCGPSEAELTRWLHGAIRTIQESPDAIGTVSTGEAAEQIVGYRPRMTGSATILGFDDVGEEKVFTVRFEKGDAFWFVLKAEEEGTTKIEAVQPVDLVEGRPTL